MTAKKKKDMKEINSHFENSVRIVSVKEVVKREHVVAGLLRLVPLEKVERLTQYKSNLTWFITFKKDFNAKLYYHKKIIIENQELIMLPPVDEYIICCFKISWLSPTFPYFNAIVEHLCCKVGKLMHTKELLDRVDNLGTGIWNITVKYPTNNNIDFSSITGRQTITEELMFITRYGDVDRCTSCNKFGHMKKTCDTFKLICPTCNKRGHNVCNLASRTAVHKNVTVADHDENPDIQPLTATNAPAIKLISTSTKLTPTTESLDQVILKQHKVIIDKQTTQENFENIVLNNNKLSSTPTQKKRNHNDSNETDTQVDKNPKFSDTAESQLNFALSCSSVDNNSI